MGKKREYGASEDSPDACFGGLGSGPGKQEQEEERRTERKGLLSGGEEDDEDGRTAAS